MIHLFRRQTGDEVSHQIVDDVRGVGCNHLGVLIFRVFEIPGHAVAVQQLGQLFNISGIEPARDERQNILAVFTAKLGARRRRCGVVTSGLAPDHFISININRHRSLGGEGAGIVH